MPITSIRFYIDPETGLPHIYGRDVSEDEVEEILFKPVEDRQGAEGSRIAIGQTQSGRFLRIIYVPDPEPHYELQGKVLTAYRRRRRKR